MFSPDGTLIYASAAPHCGVIILESFLVLNYTFYRSPKIGLPMEGKRRRGGGVGGQTEAFDPRVAASTPELLKLLAKKAKRLRATAAAKTKALSRKRSSSSNDDRVVEVVDIMTAPPGPVLAPEGAGARKASTAEAPVVLRLPAPVPRSASDGDVGVNNSNTPTNNPIIIPDTPVRFFAQHADTDTLDT